MQPLRLLVADNHEIVRIGLRSLFEQQPGWQIAGEAGDGREAVAKAKELKPDVTVLDIGMPSLNGLEATRQMLKQDSRAKVLILTTHDSDPLIHEVLDAGARGYVLKSDAGRDLVSAVDAVRRNKTFFTAKVAQMVLDGYLGKKSKPADGESPRSRLTPRQREIVQLLAEGKSSKGGDPSCQYNAAAGVSLCQRIGALRHPQWHHPGLSFGRSGFIHHT
jgi:DNA-binding NarL/FixJ family response regulator